MNEHGDNIVSWNKGIGMTRSSNVCFHWYESLECTESISFKFRTKKTTATWIF